MSAFHGARWLFSDIELMLGVNKIISPPGLDQAGVEARGVSCGEDMGI